MQIQEFLGKLDKVHQKQDGDWEALCPAHDDRRRSLGVAVGKDDRILVNCGAGCSPAAICGALGLDLQALFPEREARQNAGRPEISNVYDYRDEAGILLFQCVRFFPKDFRQRRPAKPGEESIAKNGFVWSLAGVPLVLYRLPEVLNAPVDQIVFIVEGEKDADALHMRNLVATCNPMGAGKWRPVFNEALRNRKVVILPDNDEPGRKHAEQVRANLEGVAKAVAVLQLDGLPEKGDVSDWLRGHEGKQLVELANAALDPQAGQAGNSGNSGNSRTRLYTTPDLLALQLPPIKWAVEGLLCEGLNVLAGKPKVGTSGRALNLALTVAAGGRALGDVPVQAGDVLYLSLEDRLRRIQHRTRKVLTGLVLEASANLQVAVEWPRQDQGGLDAIARWADSVTHPRLVIIDVWARFRPELDNRAQAYQQDYIQASVLKALADARGLTVLLLHHCRKASAEDVFDEISGTNGLAGAMDGSIVLTRARNEDEATLSLTGRDIDERKISIQFNKDNCTWKSLGDTSKLSGGRNEQTIRDCLAGGRLLFPKEIAEETGLPRNIVSSTCSRLVREKGVLRRIGQRYGLTLAENEASGSNEAHGSNSDVLSGADELWGGS